MSVAMGVSEFEARAVSAHETGARILRKQQNREAFEGLQKIVKSFGIHEAPPEGEWELGDALGNNCAAFALPGGLGLKAISKPARQGGPALVLEVSVETGEGSIATTLDAATMSLVTIGEAIRKLRGYESI